MVTASDRSAVAFSLSGGNCHDSPDGEKLVGTLEHLDEQAVLWSAVCDDWIDQKKLCLKQSSYAQYSCIMRRHILPYWGRQSIGELTAERVNSFIKALSERLSAKTVRDILNVFLQVVRFAEKKHGVHIDYTVVANSNGTYTVTLPDNNSTDYIFVGSVFVLPPNDEYITGIAFKAKNIGISGSNKVIACTAPDISEVVKSIDAVGGGGEVDVDNIQAPDGITWEFIPEPNMRAKLQDEGGALKFLEM